jgi:hypothetical protein
MELTEEKKYEMLNAYLDVYSSERTKGFRDGINAVAKSLETKEYEGYEVYREGTEVILENEVDLIEVGFELDLNSASTHYKDILIDGTPLESIDMGEEMLEDLYAHLNDASLVMLENLEI